MDNNTCPKQKRCKHGGSCELAGTFRGEYLCFDSKGLNFYEHEQERHRRAYAAKKRRKGRRP